MMRMTNRCDDDNHDHDHDDDEEDDDDDDDDDLNLLAPCQQLTSTLAFGLLARLDRIHMPRVSQ